MFSNTKRAAATGLLLISSAAIVSVPAVARDRDDYRGYDRGYNRGYDRGFRDDRYDRDRRNGREHERREWREREWRERERRERDFRRYRGNSGYGYYDRFGTWCPY
jgi:hypothetical protein